MKFKHLSLTLLFLLGFSFSNCDDHDCGCKGTGGFFDINGLNTISQYERTSETSIKQLDPNTEIALDDYAGFNIEFEVDYLSAACDKTHWNFSTMPSAWACSCILDGELGAKTEIFKSIDIFTIHDYHPGFLADSSIFSIINFEEQSFEDYLLENEGELIRFQNYLVTIPSKPALSDKFQVRLVLELTNGEVYEGLSEIVRFD